MTNTPAISVIMSVFNNAPHLDAAIGSIIEQSFADFEFLIVNDGSTDGSGAIVDDWARRDSRIRPLHQDNHGFIYSLNRMIAEARAPWLARMDGDDISYPDRLAAQMAWLSDNPGYAIVGTQIDLIDDAGRPAGVANRVPLTPAEFEAVREHGPLMMHNSVLMRRDVIQSIGGYRAAFRHAEDYDLWLRAMEHLPLANMSDVLVAYRQGPSQVSFRHIVEQRINAAVAFEAGEERRAGRPDPTDTLDRLPAKDELDALFARPVSRRIAKRVVPDLLYSNEFLGGAHFPMLVDYVEQVGASAETRRTVLRLIKMRQFARAGQLARALAAAGASKTSASFEERAA
jgi:glycosyltransferase involved in cell wall biosynthesis